MNNEILSDIKDLLQKVESLEINLLLKDYNIFDIISYNIEKIEKFFEIIKDIDKKIEDTLLLIRNMRDKNKIILELKRKQDAEIYLLKLLMDRKVILTQ
jgi:hypothetical protein